MPANRIHTLTRWPADPADRIDMANADIGFARAMSRIMGCDLELQQIMNTAYRVLMDAKDELLQEDE